MCRKSRGTSTVCRGCPRIVPLGGRPRRQCCRGTNHSRVASAAPTIRGRVSRGRGADRAGKQAPLSPPRGGPQETRRNGAPRLTSEVLVTLRQVAQVVYCLQSLMAPTHATRAASRQAERSMALCCCGAARVVMMLAVTAAGMLWRSIGSRQPRSWPRRGHGRLRGQGGAGCSMRRRISLATVSRLRTPAACVGCGCNLASHPHVRVRPLCLQETQGFESLMACKRSAARTAQSAQHANKPSSQAKPSPPCQSAGRPLRRCRLATRRVWPC